MLSFEKCKQSYILEGQSSQEMFKHHLERMLWRDIPALSILPWHLFESCFTLDSYDRRERRVKSACSASKAENQFLIPIFKKL